MFTNIAPGDGHGHVPHGVATLVRSDYMGDACIIHLPEKTARSVQGRILAVQVRGAGAKSFITLVNVYQAVNKKSNLPISNAVFKAIQEFRNRSTINCIPTVVAGDWNATSRDSQ